MNISAVVATYGDRSIWDRLADRAIGSLDTQTVRPIQILREHGATLAQARNAAAALAIGSHLLFVDADDVLDQHYVESMTRAIELSSIHRKLWQPATSALFPDNTTDENPTVIPPRESGMRFLQGSKNQLVNGNHLVIGTVVPKELFDAAGGFWEEPCMEDWSLWLRCFALGATSVPVPDAVYYVYQKPGGRNAKPPTGIYRQIIDRYRKWCAERGIDP